jgi:hypothetical protein
MPRLLAMTVAALTALSCSGMQKTAQPRSKTAQSLSTTTVRPGECGEAQICGTVRDKASLERLAGVSVVVTSPALQDSVHAMTDENGEYVVNDLPAGAYKVAMYYGSIEVEHANVVVASRVDASLDTAALGTETKTTISPEPTFFYPR